MSDSWSNIEVELIIADYFQMLSLELKGDSYSKAEHRRSLIPLLTNRSDGSVEFKHQNISAVLINLGQPYIKGYLQHPHLSQPTTRSFTLIFRPIKTTVIDHYRFKQPVLIVSSCY